MDTQGVIASLEEDGFGWWLSGFFDAEGCLLINRHTKPRADGQHSFYLSVCVSQRTDWRALLDEVCQRVACGRVREEGRSGGGRLPMAAYAAMSAKAVARWAAILRRFNLRGKKCKQLPLWLSAVRIKASATCAERGERNAPRWRRLEELKGGMEAVRRYQGPVVEGATLANGASMREGLGPTDGAYLSGFIAGDGYFGITRNRTNLRPAFNVTTRADDLPLLQQFQGQTGCGTITVYKYQDGRASAPAAIWQVCSKDEQQALCRILDGNSFGGRAHLQYLLWREAVAEHAHRVNGDWQGTSPLVQRSRQAKARLQCLRQAMTELRAYRPEMSLVDWTHFVDDTLTAVRIDAQLPLLAAA